MSNERDRDMLIEETAGAYRPTRHGGVGSHPAWHDLDDAGRKSAFGVAVFNRTVEAAADPEGLSATARAVLRRLQPFVSLP